MAANWARASAGSPVSGLASNAPSVIVSCIRPPGAPAAMLSSEARKRHSKVLSEPPSSPCSAAAKESEPSLRLRPPLSQARSVRSAATSTAAFMRCVRKRAASPWAKGINNRTNSAPKPAPRTVINKAQGQTALSSSPRFSPASRAG